MAKRTTAGDVTPARLEKFIAALREAYPVRDACRLAGISRSRAYELAAEQPEFAKRWEDAYQDGTELLEAEAIRRAVKGTRKPVFYEGRVCGHIREYSDTLLIFKLKARDPAKYRERIEHTGKGGGPLVVEIVRFGDDAKGAAAS